MSIPEIKQKLIRAIELGYDVTDILNELKQEEGNEVTRKYNTWRERWHNSQYELQEIVRERGYVYLLYATSAGKQKAAYREAWLALDKKILHCYNAIAPNCGNIKTSQFNDELSLDLTVIVESIKNRRVVEILSKSGFVYNTYFNVFLKKHADNCIFELIKDFTTI